MRPRLRAVGFLALAVVAITCTDAPTSPRDGRSGMSARHLSMSPSFSAAAAQVYGNLAAFGIEVTEVHVHLTGPDGSVRDTTIAFPASQDTLVIDIPVDAGGTDQPYTALLELRNAEHVVLFSGTQTVVARSGTLGTDAPPVVPLGWTGPGSHTKTVTVGPGDTTVAATATIATRATAIDSSGAAVTDLIVRWTSSDATLATATSTGNSTASVVGQGRRGTATISAITPSGIVGISRFTFVPPASRVVVVSGGGQTGVAGSLLAAPLVVEVQASDNLPVPGVPVTFRAVSAGGAVTTATVTSDALGRASTTLTLGKTGGAYQYEVASGTLPVVSVSETATPAPPAAIAIVSGDAQTDSVGRALPAPFVVKVSDQFGGAASNATVTWARVKGSGTVGSATSTTGTDGLANSGYTLGNTAGSETVSATVTGLSGPAGTVTFGATAINRGAAAIAIVSGGGQTGAPGATLATPIVVRVADALNNPVASASVTWTTPSVGTTFTPATATTDALGQVSTTVKLGTTAGPVVVSATTASLVATANLTIVPGPAAALTKLAGDVQTTEVATNVPVAPSVKVTDASGNGIAGAAVVFAVATGGGSITAPTASTDASGVATLGSWKLGNTAGANTLTATSGALSATFSATGTAGTGSVLAITTQPSITASSGTALATQPVLQLQDANGNPVAVSGITVAASITAGTGTLASASAVTDATGKATFAGLTISGTAGNFTLSFAAPSYASVAGNSISLGAGLAAKLSLTTNFSDGQSGVAFPTQPIVRVLDVSDNPVAQAGIQVSVAIATGGGTLTGTSPMTTNASGVATFSDLVVTGTAGSRTFAFSAPGLPAITTGPVNITAGAATKVVFVTAPAATAANAAPLPTQPVLQLQDASGNPVALANVSIAASFVGQTPGTLSGATVATDADGKATFTALTITGPVGSYTLSFTAGGYTPVTSGAIALSAGAATQLQFVQAPTNATARAVIAPPIRVALMDVSANVVNNSSSQVNLTITPGTGSTDATLGGTRTVTLVNGVATFSDISINLPSAGYSLTAGTDFSRTITSVSKPFDIAPAGQAGISVETGAQTAARQGEQIPEGRIVFIVLDGSLKPISGDTVTFNTFGSDDCNLTTSTTATDAAGHATLGINLGRLGYGCQIYATARGVELSAIAQVVSVPDSASHVWIGGNSAQPHSFELKENWLDMTTRTPQLPSATSVAYVPTWFTQIFPTLANDESIGSVIVDGSASVDLGGKTLTTSRDLVLSTELAQVVNGAVIATGSGITVTGAFDMLTLGRAGSCTSGKPELANVRNVITNTSMTIACGALVDYAQATTITSLPGSFVNVNDGGLLIANGSAAFNGDSLVIGSDGGVAVFGDGTFGGRLGMVSGSSIYVPGSAQFTGFGNLSGGGIDITGDVTFVGSGRAGYFFNSGGMNLGGNFAQKGTGSVFNASPYHQTTFDGSKPQSISVEQPDANGFGELDLTNDSGGITLLTSLTFHGIDPAPALYVYYSPLTVPKGVTLTQTGQINFISGGSMLLDGVATYYNCSSTDVVAPISGSGTANGAPASDGGGCSLGGGGGGGQGGSFSAARGVAPVAQPVILKPVPRPFPPRPVIRKTTTRKTVVRY
jgi:hypothetical protein